MTEPTTVNRALIVPNTGDLSGTWGSAAINPDMVAIDGMFAGVQAVTLSNTNVTLTVPAGFTATPSAGPTQSQNALIRLSGTLAGNVAVIFPMPGFYIVENNCTVGAYYVQLQSSGGGNAIGAPPGQKTHVFSDGTNMDYVDLPPIGTYLDLAATAVPAWIGACTVAPWLHCNGSTFSGATYPNLAALLGGTTLPDARGRTRFSLNEGTGRITVSGGYGIDGTTLLAAGGSETFAQANLPAVNFAISGTTLNDPGHHHVVPDMGLEYVGSSGPLQVWGPTGNWSTNGSTTGITISNQGSAASGGSGSPALPPGYVGGITLIRAG